jgi:trans-2,3-dihydro-3-hydroxyanthranilate isomerase
VPLEFVVADVFTDAPLSGNQLAVFVDASDLDEALMQPLAREIGFSETVFVLPGDAVRIFTPRSELPFAGHPVLGTAFVLASARATDAVTLHTRRGAVPVVFDERGRGTMRQPVPTVAPWGGPLDPLFDALGVAGSILPVDEYVNGPSHVYVMLATEAEVAALRPDFGRLLDAVPAAGVSCLAGSGSAWKVRVFAPSVGVDEDPATGSAAGPLAVHLCRHGIVPWGTELTITQGVELGRPSTLYASAHGNGERLESVDVSGDTVVVGSGHFTL